MDEWIEKNMHGMNRNFPPGGRGRNPRRRKAGKKPEIKPRMVPRSGRPKKGKPFLPLQVIREAGVREETSQRKNLRKTIIEHESEGKYVHALLDARALLATEVMYYQSWRKVHYDSVRRAVRILSVQHERLRRRFPLAQNEKVSRLLKTYWVEGRKGVDLLEGAFNKLTWGEKQLKKVDGILKVCAEKEDAFAQRVAREGMNALDREPFFHTLMSAPSNE